MGLNWTESWNVSGFLYPLIVNIYMGWCRQQIKRLIKWVLFWPSAGSTQISILSVWILIECFYLNAIAIQYMPIYTYIYIYITYNAIIIQCYSHVMYVIVEFSLLLVTVPLLVFILRMVLLELGSTQPSSWVSLSLSEISATPTSFILSLLPLNHFG